MTERHELVFQPGLIVNQEFFDYPTMQESAKNWLYLSKYRFGTGTFYGRHDGTQLNNLQFGHSHRTEGMMYAGLSPKDCLTIIIMQKNASRVCLNDLKMKKGDVLLLDDSNPYDFSSSHGTTMAVISIKKTLVATEFPWILDTRDKIFKDKDSVLSDTVENEWRRVLEEPDLFKNTDELKEMENKIIKAIKSSLEGQKGERSPLTEGEKTALEVRSFLLNSLNESMSIRSIAKQFNVSEKTLQNSFRSLFGITPKRFMKILKLNKAHEDLLQADAQTTNVSDIAVKWGFCNFGRFSKEFKAHFQVLPSERLNLTQI